MPRPHTTSPSPTPTESLVAIIDRFAGRRVLVVGDLILDRYLWGEVERTSPEAPVPVVLVRTTTVRPGGAANVALNLAALGARPLLLGLVGDDEAGRTFRTELEQVDAELGAHLIADAQRPTTIKTRVVSQNQQLMRFDEERIGPPAEAVRRRLLSHYDKLLKRSELVILSDYDKGVLNPELCRELVRRARAAGRPVVVDPKGTDYAKYRGASVITPNLKEARAATGLPIGDDAGLTPAARALQRQIGGDVVITRGSQGVAVFQRRQPPVLIAAQALAVYDVTGAGDSLIATLGLALAAGATLPEAARLGNAAGSIVVGRFGVATVAPEELRAALHTGTPGHKLRSAERLVGELATLRAAGKKIVFTNGCFDLLHLGHLRFLQRARQLGDVLVVALNSDASVRELKGPPRPVLGQAERVGILSSLDAVDYVVVFDDPTPEALLTQLRPDVLVKGKSPDDSDVVGRRLIERQGGRVEVLPTFGEVTTDQMLERIARQR